MAASNLRREKVVVFSGSGISAPSGISTFRGANGLWRTYQFEEVASPQGWRVHPEVVLEFYNERRAKAAAAEPNAGHRAVADLEKKFDVTVVTQNVDDLHERAGSTNVIHVHGELRKARSTANPELIYDIGGSPIQWGDKCAENSQLRPHIVWFGESIMHHDESIAHMESADRLIVVGTSLAVYPAAGFIAYAINARRKVIVDVEIPPVRGSFEGIEGSADTALPALVKRWLAEN